VNYEMWLLACHLTLIVIHAMSHSWIGWAYVSSVKSCHPCHVSWLDWVSLCIECETVQPSGCSLIMDEVSPSTPGLPKNN
jgi:hypothetical protein